YLLAIIGRQRHLRRLPARSGIRHALRAAGIEQMNMGVDDRNRGPLRKNGSGSHRCRADENRTRRRQCRSTWVTRQLPTSATYKELALRQSIALTLPKSLGPLPAW